MRIGIIGGGAIAQFLLKKINKQKEDNLHINSIYIRDKNKYSHLKDLYNVKLFTNFEQFLNSNIDIIIEAATVDAVKKLIPNAIKKKRTIIASAGAFADEQFTENIYKLVEQYKNQVYLPAGAIGGLDLLQNAHVLNEISHVNLSTKKPAHTLVDEPLNKETIIFDGPAIQAIERFPENVNVSIILSLAGIGAKKTNIRVIADPHLEKNNHTITIKGTFGQATINVENNPLKENPKTSHLAALSILGTLKSIGQPIQIG